MQAPERTTLFDWLWPIVVLVAAFGARSWYLIEYADSGKKEPVLRVQEDRPEKLSDELQILSFRKDFHSEAPWSNGTERTAHTAPGYLYFVYGLQQFPLDLDQTVRWTQCVLGALTALFYYLLARNIFRGHAVAALTGLFCALHPFWIVDTAELNDGVLASFLLGLCLFLGTVGARSGGPLISLAFGLLLALLAMVRATMLPFAFVAVLWYLWHSRSVPKSWLNGALVFLGFINGLMPWAVRNFQYFHDVFPIVDSTYYHLWIGNNPHATGGPMSKEAQLQALADQRNEDVDQLADDLADMPQPARYQSLASDVRHEVEHNPAATLQRRLDASIGYWLGVEQADFFTAFESWGSAEPWLVREWPAISSGTLLVMLMLGVLGWRWSYPWAKHSRLLTLAVVFCFLPYFLSHADGRQSSRLPLDGVLLTLAAVALAGWYDGRVESKQLPYAKGQPS
jgi:4-amino-4-deoxy-L-arabinose transferase-like glycosyltransferase